MATRYKSVLIVCAAVIVTALIPGVSAQKSNQEAQATTNCKYSVIGAGWGGAYYAYRVSLSTDAIVNPKHVCIFEASKSRVGGRAESYAPGEAWEDTHLDLG